MAKVLIIDDDPAMRRILTRVLIEANHEVIEAANGQEGVQQFLDHAPDVVITDILMAEKDGIKTIREIRAAERRTRIIAISGGGADQKTPILDFARLLGADDVLAKPFHNAALLEKIAAQLQRPFPARESPNLSKAAR